MLLCEMERERLKCSDEEEDTLARSTKKFKESHQLAGVKVVNQNNKVGGVAEISWWGQFLGPLRKSLVLTAL